MQAANSLNSEHAAPCNNRPSAKLGANFNYPLARNRRPLARALTSPYISGSVPCPPATYRGEVKQGLIPCFARDLGGRAQHLRSEVGLNNKEVVGYARRSFWLNLLSSNYSAASDGESLTPFRSVKWSR